MILETFAVGMLGCNCTILGDETTGRAVVIDPGDDAPRILRELARFKLTVTGVFHTHAHIDHVGATAALCRSTGAPGFLHADDAPLYQALPIQAQMLGMDEPESWDLRPLTDADSHRVGGLELGIMHTPGHTFGSCCFSVSSARVLFAGDTLFQRGVGRTDIGGDWPTLERTIRERLYTLADDVLVIPGHGPSTTIGEEKTGNPFVRARR